MRVPRVNVQVSSYSSSYILTKLTSYVEDRRYGWTPCSITPSHTQILKRSKRWSILPAFTIYSYLEYIIYQGSITAAIFNDFVRHRVLPHCNRFDGDASHSIIALDNAKRHWNEELVQICEEAGVVLLARLPLYSPDLDSIETSFTILKV